jgi:Domain of unknown function (DUF6249)
MTYCSEPLGHPWRRRLVLALALSLGLVVASSRTADPADAIFVGAAEAASPAANAEAPKADTKSDPNSDAKAAPAPGDSDADADAADDSEADSTVTIDKRGIGIVKKGKHVTVRGLGMDREYNSFEDFVNHAPWLAGLVFVIVLTVFLIPLLIVAILVWYKIRKTRMQNETMIKLAERGVVPPAEAMQSLVQPTPPGASVPPSAAPLYEQARQLRKRAAWSDLRKGVVMLGAGLGLSFWSMLDDGSPNSVGLVLLFVGVGYCVLWFLEDRNAPAAQRDAGVPPAGSA